MVAPSSWDSFVNCGVEYLTSTVVVSVAVAEIILSVLFGP